MANPIGVMETQLTSILNDLMGEKWTPKDLKKAGLLSNILVDALDLVELDMLISDEFSIELPDEFYSKEMSFDDLVVFVQKVLDDAKELF